MDMLVMYIINDNNIANQCGSFGGNAGHGKRTHD